MRRALRFEDVEPAHEQPDGKSKPTGGGDESVPSPACGQSGRLVPLGLRSARARPRREPAHPALHRVLGLPLVSRDGPRVVRGRSDRGGHEHPLRQHQGGPGGTARPRQDLPGRAPAPRAPPGRLAAHDVPHPERSHAVLRRDLLPAVGAPRPAGVPRPSPACRGLPRRARGRRVETERVVARRARACGAERGRGLVRSGRDGPRAGDGRIAAELRRTRRRVRGRAEVSPPHQHRAVLPPASRSAGPTHGAPLPGPDVAWRHLRPPRGRVLPLFGRRRVDDPALREDAVRQRAAARALRPGGSARIGERGAVRTDRPRDGRLGGPRDAGARGRVLRRPRRRLRGRGGPVLPVESGHGPGRAGRGRVRGGGDLLRPRPARPTSRARTGTSTPSSNATPSPPRWASMPIPPPAASTARGGSSSRRARRGSGPGSTTTRS